MSVFQNALRSVVSAQTFVGGFTGFNYGLTESAKIKGVSAETLAINTPGGNGCLFVEMLFSSIK
jgi:hypothetical protein